MSTGARAAIEAMGWTTEVHDKGIQTAGGHKVHETLFQARQGEEMVEGLSTVDATLVAARPDALSHSEAGIWDAMLVVVKERAA